MNSLESVFSISAVLLAAACSNTTNNNPQGTTNKVSVGKAQAGDRNVELLTDDALETGLTPIYIKVTAADGKAVTDADLTFTPIMSMADGTSHTCPVLGKPVLQQDDLYHVDVVFQMPSTGADTWSATVRFNDSDAEVNNAVFPVFKVTDSGRAQVFTFTDPTTAAATRYVSSLNFASPPQVGLNPVTFTLHTRQDMMTFPAVEDATIALDPQMPSMGHGSPGSVNPTPTTLGRYEGKLSFSMSGTWETTVTVSRGGVAQGAPVFTTTF